LNRGLLLRWGPLVPLALSAAGFAVKSWQVGNCAGYFFLGSALFWLHRHRRVAGPVGLGLLGGMVAAAGQHAMGLAYLMGFCSAVLLLAEADHNGWGRHARRIPWIADNCYGSYLWHFPLQLVAFLLLGGPGSTLYWSPWVLLAYVAGVTLLARASFLYIERPARNALRQWAVARRAPSAPAGDELPLPAPR
jgi:peptidoglycan/LPS O-acetylase OafA/YrhL